MIYKFSDASKKALENAERLATQMGHNFISSEHILYGIAQEEKGLGYKVLKKQNVCASQILVKVKEILGEGKIILTKTEGFTPKTKKIIENSFKETEKNFLSSIGTEIILLSILNDRDNMAFKILVELNANIDKMYEELFKIIAAEEEINQKSKNKNQTSNSFLNQHGVNLNKLALEGKIDNVIGRNGEIDRVIQILSRKNKNNPCLIGEPRSWKNSYSGRTSKENSRTRCA